LHASARPIRVLQELCRYMVGLEAGARTLALKQR